MEKGPEWPPTPSSPSPSLLTKVQGLAQQPEAPKHRQLQLEGQAVAVDGPSAGAHGRLRDQGGRQLGEDILAEATPQEVTAVGPQRAQDLSKAPQKTET